MKIQSITNVVSIHKSITSSTHLGELNLLYSYELILHLSRTLVGNKIVDNSDVVGASPVGAAPTTSSFST